MGDNVKAYYEAMEEQKAYKAKEEKKLDNELIEAEVKKRVAAELEKHKPKPKVLGKLTPEKARKLRAESERIHKRSGLIWEMLHAGCPHPDIIHYKEKFYRGNYYNDESDEHWAAYDQCACCNETVKKYFKKGEVYSDSDWKREDY